MRENLFNVGSLSYCCNWALFAWVFGFPVALLCFVKHTALIQVFGSMTHWVWSALLTWFFPLCLGVGGEYIFAFFALIAATSLVFAWWLPETKGKSLEQIQKELVK